MVDSDTMKVKEEDDLEGGGIRRQRADKRKSSSPGVTALPIHTQCCLLNDEVLPKSLFSNTMARLSADAQMVIKWKNPPPMQTSPRVCHVGNDCHL